MLLGRILAVLILLKVVIFDADKPYFVAICLLAFSIGMFVSLGSKGYNSKL